LAHLCRTARKRPATLRAYCSAGSGLVRQFPGVCWFELDEEDAQEVASLELATSTRGRLLVVLNSLLSFLEEQLGIHVVGMDRSRLRIRRRLEPVRLLRQDELERLLAYLLELAIRAHDAGNAAAMRLAYNAFHGALLATFFGLRAGELPRLLIGDVVLDAAQPYLRVWRSKRGKSRVVLAWKVPEEVLTILRREWTRRLASTGEDPAAPFLADERGDPVGARALADTVIQAMEALGLRDSGAEGRPVVFHTLRHVFANRLLVLGVSLRDVARAMGHIDTDTTTGSYLHCFDYLQRRRLAEQPVEFRHPGLSAGGIGALLGIGRPAAIAALKKADLHQMTTTTDENRRRLFWWESVVRLVADRLDMNEERRPKGDLKSVAFVGVRHGVGTTTLAVNMAAILGVVARCKTLLLDLSGNASGVEDHLGISRGRNLLNLTTPFLSAGQITIEDLAEQTVRYEPGEPWSTGVSALDIVPGFRRDQLSSAEADRVFAYRGVQLVRAVCQAANQAGYEFVLLDNGIWQEDIPRNAMLINSEQVVLVSTDHRADVARLEFTPGLLKDVGCTTLVAINGTTRLGFESQYYGARFMSTGEPVLEALAYQVVPLAKETYLSRCKEQGIPITIHKLEHTPLRLDPFASAMIAVAHHIDPQVDENLLDSEGKPVRTRTLEAFIDRLVG
jgi:integrase/cellulose biosynthesis protein BcsQ